MMEWVEFVPPAKTTIRPPLSTKRKPKVNPSSVLKPWLRTMSPIGAAVSRFAELILASYAYTALRLVVAPTAFFNLAYLVRDDSTDSSTDCL
jgi:hypothetical protein